MEEIIFIIVQVFFNFIMEVILWIPFEFIKMRTWVFSVAGVVAGLLSLLLRPHHIIPDLILRSINLAVTPLLFAWFIYWAERKVAIRREKFSPHKFFDIYFFAATFAIIRFMFAK